MLGWISDPFVCVSVLVSDLFSMWATLTALGSFFATGGCVKQTKSNNIKQFLHGRTSEDLGKGNAPLLSSIHFR